MTANNLYLVKGRVYVRNEWTRTPTIDKGDHTRLVWAANPEMANRLFDDYFRAKSSETHGVFYAVYGIEVFDTIGSPS